MGVDVAKSSRRRPVKRDRRTVDGLMTSSRSHVEHAWRCGRVVDRRRLIAGWSAGWFPCGRDAGGVGGRADVDRRLQRSCSGGRTVRTSGSFRRGMFSGKVGLAGVCSIDEPRGDSREPSIVLRGRLVTTLRPKSLPVMGSGV